MFFPIVQMAVLIISQSKLSSQGKFIHWNKQVQNTERLNLCHPDLKLTFQDCCLQPLVQRSCIYCRQFVFSCKSVKGTLNPTPTEEFSQFHKEAGVLNSGQDNGVNGPQEMSNYVSSATDQHTGASNTVHDPIKRSKSTRAKLLPRVKEKSSMSNDEMSTIRSSLSKHNTIHEINQVKEFQPLHKQFTSKQEMRSSRRRFNDKNRMNPIGHLNAFMALPELTNKDTNSDLITKVSFNAKPYFEAADEEVTSDYTESKSAPRVINLPVYLESKQYTSRLINDSGRRRQFLSNLHNFRKDKNKLEIQRECGKPSGREDIKSSGCIEYKSKNSFISRGLELVTAGVEKTDTSDDRRELQFNPLMAADDQVPERVQSVRPDEIMVKRWGSLGAGKFRRWWFGN